MGFHGVLFAQTITIQVDIVSFCTGRGISTAAKLFDRIDMYL
jgi:hypothetical protein